MPISAGTEIGFHTNTVSATTCVVTLTAGASVGDLVVVSCANDGTTVSSITDNATGGPNTWDRRVNISTGGFAGVCIAWTIVTAALAIGNTITVTAGGAVDQVAHVEKFTSAAASPVDQSQSNGDATGTVTAPTSNATPATTQADGMLFGAGCAGGNNPTFTPAVQSPTWTATTTEAQRDVASLWQHYRNVSSTGTFIYNGTFSVGDSYSFGIVAFKAAGGGATAPAAIPIVPDVSPHPSFGPF